LTSKATSPLNLSIRYEITQRKQIELRQAALIEALSRKNRDLEQFSFITSYNLRAPVANLLGLLGAYDRHVKTI
jgi:light-regulated signal transduction histidine kinase (bacteriophytochrome)